MSPQKALLKRIALLKDHFDMGSIPRLAQHEVNPEHPRDSRDNYLYFTLPVSINFQRSSTAMWQSALKTYEDDSTRYLFYPEEVVQRPEEQIRADLVKHRLGLQPNRHTAIWRAISQTLHDYYEDDPRQVLAKGNFDAQQILELLRITEKKHFPYLSGAKMANYWLYILSHYTDADFTNPNAISIIPDTHVIQASKVLGVTDGETNPEKVAKAWEELLKGSDLRAIDLHPVLWNWSRNGFKPEV